MSDKNCNSSIDLIQISNHLKEIQINRERLFQKLVVKPEIIKKIRMSFDQTISILKMYLNDSKTFENFDDEFNRWPISFERELYKFADICKQIILGDPDLDPSNNDIKNHILSFFSYFEVPLTLTFPEYDDDPNDDDFDIIDNSYQYQSLTHIGIFSKY